MTTTFLCNMFLAASSPIDLDATIIIQVIIFFVLLFFLTFLLYRPILNTLEARFSKTEGLNTASQKLLEKTASLAKQYNSRIKKHKKESEKFTAQLRQKVRTDESEILGKAKNDSSAMIEEARAHLRQLEDSLKKELNLQVEEMAQSLAAKIISGENITKQVL